MNNVPMGYVLQSTSFSMPLCAITTAGTRIGRAPDCQIILNDYAVSAHHAIIWLVNDQVYVNDEGSANGTFIDGRRIPINTTFPLRTGQSLQMGGSIFRLAVVSTGANTPMQFVARSQPLRVRQPFFRSPLIFWLAVLAALPLICVFAMNFITQSSQREINSLSRPTTQPLISINTLPTTNSDSISNALIVKPAVEMNLTLSDLASGFSVSSDQGLAVFGGAEHLDDGSYMLFESSSSIVESTIGVLDGPVPDTTSELHSGSEDKLRKEAASASATIAFTSSSDAHVGDRSLIEDFVIHYPSGDANGYVVTFAQQNVLVLLIEIGIGQNMEQNTVLSHARLIESRIH